MIVPPVSVRQNLSDALILAVHILKTQPTWFGRMKEELESVMTEHQISNNLDTLSDWDIVEMFYGKTTEGKAGNLFKITHDAEPTIRDLLNKFDPTKPSESPCQ